MDRGELYQRLYAAFKNRYKNLQGKRIQEKTNEFWKDAKSKPTHVELVEKKIQELNSQLIAFENQNSISRFFTKKTSTLPSSPVKAIKSITTSIEIVNSPTKVQPSEADHLSTISDTDRVYDKPKQVHFKEQLFQCSAELDRLKKVRDFGLATNETFSSIQKNEKQKKEIQKTLKRLELNAEYSRKSRSNKRAKIEKLQNMLKPNEIVQSKSGRCPIESTQPELLKTIVDIVISQSAADDKRRCSVLYTCRTLDDLHQSLKDKGFSLSRTTLYHRLVPKRWNSSEGKRHVNTVPVKLFKASACERKKHADSHFAAATVNYLKDLAVVLGAGPVFFLSQDDKCRVPLGLPAATKQAPFLMSLERRVRLPDHDFVVAPRHKLIPSVYACAKITDAAVSYSGPTFIAIRSGKHDKSDASTHAFDFNELLALEEFTEVAKTKNGQVKPVVIISVDGGPDENPRYSSVQEHAIGHFLNYDLDALFIVTHAPGQSAYNIVERRMAPLSHDLAGLILPHEFYGNHLNSSLKCINDKLERQNFSKAGEVLAEVWSKTIIDGEPVVSTYIEANQARPLPKQMPESWKSIHIRSSQYLFQIVKCNAENCCKPRRSTIANILPNRFIPAPVKFGKNERGVFVASIDNNSGHFGSLSNRALLSSLVSADLPFDNFCPTIQESLITRTCKNCKIYHCSVKALALHRRFGCNIGDQIDVIHEIEQGEEGEEEEEEIEEREEKDDKLEITESQEQIFDIPIFSIESFVPLFKEI